MKNFLNPLGKRFLMLFFPLLFLFSCSVFPENALRGNVYDVGANLNYKKLEKRSSLVLGVELPFVRSQLLNSYIVVRDGNDRLTNFFLRLSDSLPMHFQTRTVEALRKASIAGLIVRTTDGITPSVTLKSEILNFEIRKEQSFQKEQKEQKEQGEDIKKTKYYFVFKVNFIVVENKKKPRIFSSVFKKEYLIEALTEEEIVYKIRKSMGSVFGKMLLWLDKYLPKQEVS